LKNRRSREASALSEAKIYEVAARAFHAEGVKVLFSLTGDGNMHWEAALAALPDVRSFHVRHEHAACAMATAYARASGDVGVASVTCGPGLTQIMTALATAVQARIPLVLLAGEAPIHATWYNQYIDQAPLVTATGAVYLAARSKTVVLSRIQEAFITARTRQVPVVLGLPLDVQQELVSDSHYVPSRDLLPPTLAFGPSVDLTQRVVERIKNARRVIVLAGRGALGAVQECQQLAERVDGGLAATLPARGIFNGDRRDLGIAGGFAHEAAREAFLQADLVIAVGTSLTRHTSDLNTLFKPEQVIQIDNNPVFFKHGQVPASLHVVADARLALQAICAQLEADDRAASQWDIPSVSRRVSSEPADTAEYPEPLDALDPRDVVSHLDAALPKDWAMVSAAGHQSYFASHFYGRDAKDFLTIREFGAIGNGLSYAIGRAAYRPEQPVVLIEGDGGFLMHVQELETLVRCGLKILIIIFNDGAYGSEIHKLRADGISEQGAIFGFGNLASVAQGFGLAGHVVTNPAQFPDLRRSFEEGSGSALWDVRISDRVMAPTMRRQTRRQ
jgi:thiamine pyrophosphate-dependent acetolactate synthase large subunit-like protein